MMKVFKALYCLSLKDLVYNQESPSAINERFIGNLSLHQIRQTQSCAAVNGSGAEAPPAAACLAGSTATEGKRNLSQRGLATKLGAPPRGELAAPAAPLPAGGEQLGSTSGSSRVCG